MFSESTPLLSYVKHTESPFADEVYRQTFGGEYCSSKGSPPVNKVSQFLPNEIKQTSIFIEPGEPLPKRKENEQA